MLLCIICYMTSHEYSIINSPEEDEYPKLIRDKIPEIAQASGKEIDTRRLEDEELLHYLLKKAVEEARELAHPTSEANLLEEIADLREVIDAILELKGVSAEQIQVIQNEKKQKRGGFKLRLLMLNND